MTTAATARAATRPHGCDLRALGTYVRVVVTDPAALAIAVRALSRQLAEIDRACSRFRPDSEVAAVEGAGGRPVPISPLFAAAVTVALDAAQLTDGDLDPTVGGALVALGYDRDFADIRPDIPAPRVSVRRHLTWRDVDLDVVNSTLAVPRGCRLDLGATAKAFAADRAARAIAHEVGCGVLVNLGGDVAVHGDAPDGGWVVRVQDAPGDTADTPSAPVSTVVIRDGGLATSSTAVRRWRNGGDVVHHIVDPRTARPTDTCWRTVSVAAGSCVDANTASTTAVIRGDRALGWLASLRLPARLVETSGRVHLIGGWPEQAA